MRRSGKLVLAAAGLLVGLPLLGLGAVVVGANTAPGRHLIERLVPRLTDGRVTIDGLSGRFPDALRARHIAVSDPHGTWLAIDQARLDWSPLSLLRGEVRVETLAASTVAVSRLPESSGSGTSGAFLPPLPVAVADFRVDRLAVAAAIAGTPAQLRITGTLALSPDQTGSIALDAERLDGAGSYRLSGTLTADALGARVTATEPMHGLLSGIAGLPELGSLSLSAALDGPLDAERARLSLSAGPLRVRGAGTLDLKRKTLAVDLTAAAPAMRPRADLSWQSARIEAHVHGSFARPEATGHLDIEALRAGGWSLAALTGEIRGDSGSLALDASLAGLRIPGPRPDLFAGAPLALQANATLDAPRRPVIFTLSHPLLSASGAVDTDGALDGSVTVALPALAPYAAVAGLNVEGRAALTAHFARRGTALHVGVTGAVGVTGGMPAATALLGDNATLALSGALDRGHVTLDALHLDGRSVQVSATGSNKAGVVAVDWQAALSDLAAIGPRVAGTVSAHGHLTGLPDDLALTAEADGLVSVAGSAKEKLTVSLRAQGLPAAPSGTITAQGRLAGAPLRLAAAVSRKADGTLELALNRLQWKSADGHGKLTLAPGAALPLGQMQVRVTRIGDLAPLIGVTAGGSASATLDTVLVRGTPQVRIRAEVQRLAVGGAGADRVTVEARVDDPAAHPNLALTADAQGIRQAGVTGSARLTANGSPQSLALRLTSRLQTPQGPAALSAAATLRLPQRELQLASLQVNHAGETTRLLAPARITFAGGVAVDNLRLGVGGAVLSLAGRVTPALALTVSARNLTPTLAKPWLGAARGSGALSFDGRLRGTLAAPEGTLRLTGRGLRLTTGSFGGLPPANIDATATLGQGVARLDARLAAGANMHLRLAGTLPLRPAAPVDIRLTGVADLTLLDPLLTPNGWIARGQVTLNLGIAGSLAAPRATGTVRLARGSMQGFVEGVHITDMTGTIEAAGDSLRIASLSGRAGPGTLSVAGTIGVFQPLVPVSLTVTARNARPLASDLLSATMSADVTLRGQLYGALAAAGEIRVARATINIPDRLPQGVATLNVRRPGVRPPPPPAPGPAVALALTIAAPRQVFVRGHGIDAEMGGTLKLGGTTVAPTVGGGFDLRRGAYSLAGQTLTFTSGRVTFDGSNLVNKLDPTIHFVAQSTANNLTATLTVTGYADAPKIQLSSSPELPQDQILGQLLFGQNPQQLSPFQLAAVGQAIAALGGVGIGDPLAAVRTGLGLDRLSVSGASSGGLGATLEAGKYVASGVYVGARQGSSGGSQVKVQIDLTKHLKLESTLGTGGTPATGITPQNDPGSSIGLTYQFEY
ncbi:MAG TPA: translocation/assembly module TamB domain-containing protein [Stellaceae bacterium]|nr:translocation/assembly module TamB domain-containing protein [Stellaceae bacterium]